MVFFKLIFSFIEVLLIYSVMFIFSVHPHDSDPDR